MLQEDKPPVLNTANQWTRQRLKEPDIAGILVLEDILGMSPFRWDKYSGYFLAYCSFTVAYVGMR